MIILEVTIIAKKEANTTDNDVSITSHIDYQLPLLPITPTAEGVITIMEEEVMVAETVAEDETTSAVEVALNIHNELYHHTYINSSNGLIHHIPNKIISGIFHHGNSLIPLRNVCTRQLETRINKLVFLGKSQIIRLM